MRVDSFPYRLMVDELRAEILDGARPPGSRMPSENQLAMRYNASSPEETDKAEVAYALLTAVAAT